MKKFIRKVFSSRTLVVLVLLLEVLAIILGLMFVSDFFAEIKAILTIGAIIVVIFVFNSRCNTSYKIAWLTFIAILPIFGSVCYVLFANKKFTKREKRRLKPIYEALKITNSSEKSNNCVDSINQEKDPNAYFFGKYLDQFADSGIYKDTNVTYYPWGQDAWPVMLEEMEKAKHYIFLEYFIIQEGIMWNAMLDILARKAKEGLDIRMMYDDLGSLGTLPANYYKQMRALGIKCVAVNRIRAFVDIRMNNRDHRKILVIDGHTGFTGGINLADEYINRRERFGKWKDNAIKLEGDGVFGLTALFLSHWASENKIRNITPEDAEKYLPSVYKDESNKKFNGDGYVAPYGSLPFTYETVGENVYLSLLLKAKHYVYITTPYLIMDEQLNNAMMMAAKGGVKIKLLTPHIPDKKMVFDLTRSYYRDLIEAGVEVYEYTPGFVHAKTFVVDGEMATVGTINLDYRSLFLHMENGCFLYKCSCIKDIEKDMIETFDNSRQITYEMIKSSPSHKRILRRILRIFSSAM